MPWKQRLLLIILASINFTHILDFMIMMPLGNKLMPYFHIDLQQFSILISAYSISAGISGFTAAFIVDKYDRKKVLLIGYTGFIIGTACCAIAPTYPLLLTARIAAGLFGGVIGGQVLSIVADIFPYEKRASAMGIVFAAFAIASGFGIPFSMYLASHISWHAPFIVISALGIIIIAMVWRFIPPINTHLQKGAADVKRSIKKVLYDLISVPKQRMGLLLSGFLMFGHFLVVAPLNPYLEFNFFLTDDQRTLVYLIGGIVVFISSPILGRFADKYGKHKTFNLFALLSIIPIFLITNLPVAPYYYMLMITGVWFLLSSGRGIPAQAIISNVVEPQRRGSFMSFNSCVQQLFTGVASFLAGSIAQTTIHKKIIHYNWIGYISIAVVFVSIWIASKLNVAPSEISSTRERKI